MRGMVQSHKVPLIPLQVSRGQTNMQAFVDCRQCGLKFSTFDARYMSDLNLGISSQNSYNESKPK